MNKTIIININGIVFHIEEDAYEVLRSYMTEVKRHFVYSPDSVEIVTDIENRLAEMFTERLTISAKQVIDLVDVTDVTAQMGRVSDFEIDDDAPAFVESEPFKTGKKLYRDMDDRIIGGVCSGVGHYFDIEARWVRIIFLLLFLFGGTGFMLYVILWLVMPRAVSRADRMAMKGEPINLQNFKRNFDEEVEGLRHGFSRAHSEAVPLINKLGKALGSILKVFIKIIGGFVIFIGGMVLLGLTIGLLVFLGFWNSSELNTFPFNIFNPEYKSVLSLSAFILLFIPLAALTLFAIRVIFNRRIVTRISSFAMLIIWLTGLGLAIYFGSKVAGQFTEEATFSQVTEIKPDSVYYLKLNTEKYLSKEDSMVYNIDPGKFRGRTIIRGRNEDYNMPRNVRLNIEMSDTDKPILTQEFSAKGPDFETALKTAQQTHYRFIQQDSVLQFDWNTQLRKNQLWRDQEVRLTLRLPKNTKLIIDGGLNRYLEDYNLRDCQEDDSYTASSEWIVTESGLKCTNDSLYRKNRGELVEQ
ncbi:PspC domain-containing protein [Daejeonella oryzae]|uniref:PspC domain-containing protein n=1 Tax=Daejeonella oryzae TaxID=1122943 RepID=UPI0003FC761A|nr:PspC domain-containing protein [Daejeonella oryzae]